MECKLRSLLKTQKQFAKSKDHCSEKRNRLARYINRKESVYYLVIECVNFDTLFIVFLKMGSEY